MSKFLKWEFKESAKGFLSIILLMSLAVAGFWTFIGVQLLPTIMGESGQVHMMNGRINGSLILGLIVLGTFGLTIAAYISFIIQVLRSFTNDLYTKEGSLKATLPITKSQYLIAKYIIPLLWTLILTILFVTENILFAKFSANIVFDTFKSMLGILSNWKLFIIIGVNFLLGFTFFVAVMYFFIALFKAIQPNRTSGILGIIFGFLFMIFISTIQPYLPNVFGSIQINLLTEEFQYINGVKNHILNYGPHNINIDGILLHLLITIPAFIGTVYLLKKKIDL